MDSSPLEDGSTAFYDAGGNLTQIVQRDGSVYQADTTIWSDFAKNVAGGVGDAIRSAFAKRTTSAATPAQPVAVGGIDQRTLLTIGALIVGAIILKKLIA